MRVVINVSPTFSDQEVFKEELMKILDIYSYNTNYFDYEYIFIENKFIEDILEDLELDSTIFRLNSNKTSTYNARFENMIEYAIKDENCLIIDFEEYDSLNKFKYRLYRKYSEKSYISIITYLYTYVMLQCCNQYLSNLETDEEFHYFECDICKNKYFILKILIEEFLKSNKEIEIIQKKNYLKGEFC